MANFQQICKINTNYTTKQPDLEIRLTKTGKEVLSGKLTWLDGKKDDGKSSYQWFYFFTYDKNIISFLQANVNELLRVEGFLKNKHWKNDKGEWQNRSEIQLTKAERHIAGVNNHSKAKANAYVEDDEIPY